MITDGGPAFPFYCTDMHNAGSPGMTLRDWFAGMALQWLVPADDADCYAKQAKLAYEQADAMIAARAKENT